MKKLYWTMLFRPRVDGASYIVNNYIRSSDVFFVIDTTVD